MSQLPVPAPPTSIAEALPGPFVENLAAAFLVGYQGATRAAYSRDLRDWFLWCVDHGVDPLGARRAHIDAYARTLAELPDKDGKTRSPATVARRLSTLAGFYRYAVAEDVIGSNPVSNVRRPKVGTDSVSTGLDKDELAALIRAAQADSPRSLALVLLLGLNGLRISEALGADVRDLGTERGHRVLRIKRKGGKRATVPLAPRTADAVDAYVADRTDGPLFITGTGHRWHRSEAWRTLRRLAKVAVPEKAGSLHPHDLRHAFVTLSLDAGASLRDVQDAAGHADPRTTRRYDRARHNLDKHPTYALAGLVASLGAGTNTVRCWRVMVPHRGAQEPAGCARSNGRSPAQHRREYALPRPAIVTCRSPIRAQAKKLSVASQTRSRCPDMPPSIDTGWPGGFPRSDGGGPGSFCAIGAGARQGPSTLLVLTTKSKTTTEPRATIDPSITAIIHGFDADLPARLHRLDRRRDT